MRRWGPWVALGLIVVVALSVLVVRSRPSNSDEARARRLEKELACPVCTGESVADSNASESQAIRSDIRDRIRAGQSDAEIRAAYVRVYGQRMLLNPGSDGFGLLAWGIPIVAVIVAAGGLVLALRRWTRQP